MSLFVLTPRATLGMWNKVCNMVPTLYIGALFNKMKRVALILLLSQHVLGDKVKLRKHRKTGGVHGRMLSGEAGDSCQYANDGECDVPEYCDAGTDTTDCCSTVPPTSGEQILQDGISGCNCGSAWYPNTVFDANSGCVCDASKGFTQTGSNWYECGCATGFEEVNGECKTSLGGLGEQVNSCPGGSVLNGGGLVTARGFSELYLGTPLDYGYPYTSAGFLEDPTCSFGGNFDDPCSPTDTWIQTDFEPTCLCQTRTDNSNTVPQIFDENNNCVQVTQTIVESDASCGDRGDLDERMCKQVGHWQKRFSLEPFFETPLTVAVWKEPPSGVTFQLFASDDRDISGNVDAHSGATAYEIQDIDVLGDTTTITTDTISMDSGGRAGAWKHCIDTGINFYKDGNNGKGCRVKSSTMDVLYEIISAINNMGLPPTLTYKSTSFCSSAGFNSEPDVPDSEWDTREFQICRCAIGERWTGAECVCDASRGFSGSPCRCEDGYEVLGDTCVETCSPGQELTGGTCTNCDAGKYSVDGQACINCGAGKYNEQEGSTAEAACKDCDAGKYSNQLGQDACTDCAAGKYNEQLGSTVEDACTNCAEGKYNTQEGSTAEDACTDCDVGTYSEAGEACNPCDAGKYNFFAGQGCIDVSLEGLIGGYKHLQNC